MELLLGNCLDEMRGIAENSIDAIVTDPPYGISFMGKKWDNFNSKNLEERLKREFTTEWVEAEAKKKGKSVENIKARLRNELAGTYDRTKQGVLNFQKWSQEWAIEAYRILKPGAHLTCFCSPRMYHRMTCGIEDAGFEIRDQIQWLYGQGFPKSHSLGNGIGTALKPSNEPIVLARKPISEKNIALNVLVYGTGGINIEGCRINYQSEKDKSSAIPQGRVTTKAPKDGLGKTSSSAINAINTIELNKEEIQQNMKGRWPSNVILDEEASKMLDKQSGNCKSAGKYKEETRKKPMDCSRSMFPLGGRPNYGNETGGASRFFYCAKTSKRERGEGNNHPTVKPIKLMEYLIKLITPKGGIVLDPFMGSGTTGMAALKNGFDFVGIEKEQEYFNIARKRINDVFDKQQDLFIGK